MSVITALTSQNTTGVSDIHIIPANFVEQQIKDVITDIPPKCIKTGTWKLLHRL
jgi:hydroxymethylpyrimidine/phosphomethylpyrimidine kinase